MDVTIAPLDACVYDVSVLPVGACFMAARSKKNVYVVLGKDSDKRTTTVCGLGDPTTKNWISDTAKVIRVFIKAVTVTEDPR